ncbi:GxxExxY protein [Pedobacter mendelii]|uniref:GxxExxY protein n=1 Tax=Pedobacter mendelii TaxID=1908240 RepID=A0ABQ2BJ26_9SPHI|nr:GxxExxY protein [Pedobacter mendelii]GGI27397.1 hypothetical protein GCM10008119_27450 [Pedobacter mendelii]
MTKIYNQDDYSLQDETYQIIGIAMEVHRILGKGLLEVVYKDAVEYELITRGIHYKEKNSMQSIIKEQFYHIDFMLIF